MKIKWRYFVPKIINIGLDLLELFEHITGVRNFLRHSVVHIAHAHTHTFMLGVLAFISGYFMAPYKLSFYFLTSNVVIGTLLIWFIHLVFVTVKLCNSTVLSFFFPDFKQESPADARVTRDSAVIPRWRLFHDGRHPPSWNIRHLRMTALSRVTLASAGLSCLKSGKKNDSTVLLHSLSVTKTRCTNQINKVPITTLVTLLVKK